MRVGRFIASVLASLCAVSAQAAPLEAYGQLPSLEDVSISPDGKNLSFVTNVGNKRTVIVKSVADRTTLAAIAVGDTKLRNLSWADNDHLLITTSVTRVPSGMIGIRQELLTTQSYSLSTHKFFALLNDQKSFGLNIPVSSPEIYHVDGQTKVFVQGYTYDDHFILTLFSIDLDDGISTPVAYADKHTQDWLLNSKGEIVAQVLYDGDEKRWSLKLHRGGKWVEAYNTIAPIETPTVYTYGPDGNSVVVDALENGDHVYKMYDVETGAVSTPPELGGGDIITDRGSRRIAGTSRVSDTYGYTYLNHADQLAWNSVAHAFPGENVSITGWSDDRRRIVVQIDGAHDGSVFELVDLDARSADVVGPLYRGIAVADRADVKFISYKAADGREIPAYLTLPNGRPPNNLPLVVLPHGGPATRDMPGFDWWAQALASRGYVVLQPQYRGSDGFGWDHLSAGFGEWGRKMQTDLSDGVRYLAKLGTIDPKRVCIVGASYGGYAALAGVTMDPGVYRCAVAVAGVSDPRTMLDWDSHEVHSTDYPGLRYMKRFMGVETLSDPRLDEISPAAHAAQDTAPVLLIHGRDDTVVYFNQSTRMADALKAAGKPVTFITLDAEDHWLSRSETRLQMLQATVSFLEANNPPN